MAATPSNSFNFKIGDITFFINKQNYESTGSLPLEVVTVDYDYDCDTTSEAGICLRF